MISMKGEIQTGPFVLLEKKSFITASTKMLYGGKYFQKGIFS